MTAFLFALCKAAEHSRMEALGNIALATLIAAIWAWVHLNTWTRT